MDRNGNGNFVADPPPPSAPPIEMSAYPPLLNPTSHTTTATAADVKGGKISKGIWFLLPSSNEMNEQTIHI